MTKPVVKAAAQNKRKADIDSIADILVKSFGKDAAVRGGLKRKSRVVPSGSLSLDFEMGTGGWELGYLYGVYGPRDIGKSSMIGLSGVRNAQQMGLNCAWIALEPFDEAWATKNGVNVEELLVAYPTTAEEAFGMTIKIVLSGKFDFIVFDSLGAVLGEGEMDDDGKPRMGGQSGLITWFVKAVAPKAYKNEVAIILLNQVRHDFGARGAGVAYKQPGGEALEHLEQIIVRLRRGKERYTIKQNGTDIQIGNQVVAVVERNKKTEGTGHKATFDYFYAETDDYPFGIDGFSDVINTAKRTGVIKQAGSYFDLPNGKRLQGQKAVTEYLEDNPDSMDEIREAVLQVMAERNAKNALVAAEATEEVTS